MHAKLLIDGIVQQTTVLIAQISTAAGVRAPLAHIADQVFVDLAREIEAQGVGRKVVADMFGLALRSYQKRVQRLAESATLRRRTLWEAVYEHIQAQRRVRRTELNHTFRHDASEDVGAVLSDLVQHGLVFATGRGANTVYRPVDAEDREAFLRDSGDDALDDLVWLHVYRQGSCSRSRLPLAFAVQADRVQAAVERLLDRGQLRSNGGADALLTAESFVVEVGADQGWEAAVFDHFSSMAAAIVMKLRLRTQAREDDRVGGGTISLDVHPEHPMAEEVYGLLRRVRAEVDALWHRVHAHNQTHPVPEDQRVQVYFYYGQSVADSAGIDEERETT